MNKQSDPGLTVTHVYGAIGVILGVVALIVSFKAASGIADWLLLGSGWMVTAFLAWFLIRTSSRLTEIIRSHDLETAKAHEDIGRLEERVADLQKEVDRRHATLDYLSSQLMTGHAMPRRPQANQALNESGE